MVRRTDPTSASSTGLPCEPTVSVPLSALERVRLSIGRGLDKRLNFVGVWLYRRTGGGITRPWKVDALLLTTTGRRTGRERTVVLQFFPDQGAMIVAAASAGAISHPGWYFNLTAEPVARVQGDRRMIVVRAERLAAEEAAAFWPRLLRRAPDYARYLRATDRAIPLVRLVPA